MAARALGMTAGLAMALASLPASAALPPPSLPGSEPRASGQAPDWTSDPQRWRRRHRGLITGVSISSAAVLGGFMGLIPLAFVQDGEDGTPYVGSIIVAPSVIAVGALSTVVTGTFSWHHRRWDSPVDRAARPERYSVDAVDRHRLRLRRSMWGFGGAALGGGVVIGIGYAAALGCPDTSGVMDDCANRRAAVGVITGGSIALASSLGFLSSAILLGLARHHGHRSLARWQPSPGGLTLRF